MGLKRLNVVCFATNNYTIYFTWVQFEIEDVYKSHFCIVYVLYTNINVHTNYFYFLNNDHFDSFTCLGKKIGQVIKINTSLGSYIKIIMSWYSSLSAVHILQIQMTIQC